jgi:hypothetical protein
VEAKFVFLGKTEPELGQKETGVHRWMRPRKGTGETKALAGADSLRPGKSRSQ